MMLSQVSRRTRSTAGAVVAITGAARGMGELYARTAVREGAKAVALIDRDSERTERLAAELGSETCRVLSYTVEMSDREAVLGLADQLTSDLGPVDVLVNNAGVVRGAPFWEHDPERDIDFTLLVNTHAPMWLTRALLPQMIADRDRPKRILNVASAAATLANPNMSVYAASKWALLGWSDSLRLELARTSDTHHIAVTTFCPSYVSTGMFAGARGPLLTPILRPQVAAARAWSGMLRGTPIVCTPWTVKLAMAMRGVLPTRVWDVIADRVFHVYSSMDAFTGRTDPPTN